MKKIILLIFCSAFSIFLFAQDSTQVQIQVPKKKSSIDLSNRANDHFLIQLGYAGWAGKPDTLNIGGLSKSFNVYFMFDFPFKTNPHLSMAFGPGIATDHILFKKTFVGIKDLTTTLHFTDQSDTNHFKKTKLATAYLEAPIEFRYSSNPATPNSSYKFALGIKIGTILNAHVKGKTWEDKNNKILLDYTQKESNKRFFNSYRFSATA